MCNLVFITEVADGKDRLVLGHMQEMRQIMCIDGTGSWKV